MACVMSLIREFEGDLMAQKKEFIAIDNLKTQFFTSKGIVKAIDGVSFSIRSGEVYGLVGESGCGKSVTATSILDLLPEYPGRSLSGRIFIDGFNVIGDYDRIYNIKIKSETNVRVKRNKRLLKRHNYVLSGIRGKKVSMIFQDPFLSLNPVLRIGTQITESLLLHSKVEMADAILNRESLSEKQVSEFYDSYIKLEDVERRKFVNNWTRSNGLSEIEVKIYKIFENSSDPQIVRRELSRLFESQKTGVDLYSIDEAKRFFEIEARIHDLNLSLLQAEYTGNNEQKAQIEEEISVKKDERKSNFGSYMLKHRFLKKRMDSPFVTEATRRAIELLKLVNIAAPERIINSYPHELSGGMQQRVMIAMALATNPGLLIADEPTTALDVTTQAQILDLIRDLNNVFGASILFITHDLAVIAEMCQRVGVMYAGNLVEETGINEIFTDPKHPYTIGLLKSLPRADSKRARDTKLESIPGSVPNLIDPPKGCRFHPRCQFAMDKCSLSKPKLVEISPEHKVACFLYSDEEVTS